MLVGRCSSILMIVGDESISPPFVRDRYANLHKVLSKYFTVTFTTVSNHLPPNNNGTNSIDNHSCASAVASLVNDMDAVFIDGRLLHRFPFLKSAGVPIAIDLYDPVIAGDLNNWRSYGSYPTLSKDERLALISEQITTGDSFFCANEAQQDYWLGWLSAYNRVNPIVYAEDKTMSTLLAVLPWGVGKTQPEDGRPILREVVRGIRKDDVLAIWILEDHPWLDSSTLIEAVARLEEKKYKLKVVFLVRNRTAFGVVAAARQESDARGLTDRRVFFVECSNDEIWNFLREADLGISLQKGSFPAQFAARPEIAAYLGAGLPVLVSHHNAQVIADHSLGKVVIEASAENVARGLQELAHLEVRQAFRNRIRSVVEEISWESAAVPLVQWCKWPRSAPDNLMGYRSEGLCSTREVKPTPIWALPGRAAYYLRTTGLSGLAAEMRSYIQWRLVEYRR